MRADINIHLYNGNVTKRSASHRPRWRHKENDTKEAITINHLKEALRIGQNYKNADNSATQQFYVRTPMSHPIMEKKILERILKECENHQTGRWDYRLKVDNQIESTFGSLIFNYAETAKITTDVEQLCDCQRYGNHEIIRKDNHIVQRSQNGNNELHLRLPAELLLSINAASQNLKDIAWSGAKTRVCSHHEKVLSQMKNAFKDAIKQAENCETITEASRNKMKLLLERASTKIKEDITTISTKEYFKLNNEDNELIKKLQQHFVFVPCDKSPQTIIAICKKHYVCRINNKASGAGKKVAKPHS